MPDHFSESRLHRMAARTGLAPKHRASLGTRRLGLGRSVLGAGGVGLLAAGLLYTIWRLALWLMDRVASS